MSFDIRVTNIVMMLCLGAIGALNYHMAEDISAIRRALEPKTLIFGAEPPPFRARVDFREKSRQEPEVTLL